MAITDAYGTAVAYRAVMGGDSSDDTQILEDLTTVSRWMDAELGRCFTKDASVVNRVYWPSKRAPVLKIDDIASISGLVIKVDTDQDGDFADESAFAAGDYQLAGAGHDLNVDKGSDPRPWREIWIPPTSSQGWWTPGFAVQVTAIFGWASVPQAIQSACIQFCGILRVESPRASRNVDAEGTVLSMSSRARDIIAELMDNYGLLSVAAA